MTIRLLDPPLHEFLPHDGGGHSQEMAAAHRRQRGRGQRQGRGAARDQPDARPPRLPARHHLSRRSRAMQARAIIEAACTRQERRPGRAPRDHDPARRHQEGARAPDAPSSARPPRRSSPSRASKVDYLVGTMIEIPRAALTADEIAEAAEFFSFGTNDLTQMTFGVQPRRRRQVPAALHRARSSDLAGRSVPDPRPGGRRAAGRDRHREGPQHAARASSSASAASTAATRRSSKFCHRIGLNYVSCSPFRVPIARLAAAQAAIEERGELRLEK